MWGVTWSFQSPFWKLHPFILDKKIFREFRCVYIIAAFNNEQQPGLVSCRSGWGTGVPPWESGPSTTWTMPCSAAPMAHRRRQAGVCGRKTTARAAAPNISRTDQRNQKWSDGGNLHSHGMSWGTPKWLVKIMDHPMKNGWWLGVALWLRTPPYWVGIIPWSYPQVVMQFVLQSDAIWTHHTHLQVIYSHIMIYI